MEINVYEKFSDFKQEYPNETIGYIRVMYVRHLIIQSLIGLGLLFFIVFLKAITSGRTSRTQYPSSKYKKVVKEGLLWDTTEYHER